MEFLKIIHSIEEAVYEIATWFILIPKTTGYILRYPGRIPAYIRQETAKEEKDQFSDQMSPVIFWILLVSIPGYFVFKKFYWSQEYVRITSTEQGLVFFTLFILSLLLTPAVLIQAFARVPFTKRSFREFFLVQCYLQTPFCLLSIICFSLLKYLQYDFKAMDKPDYTLVLNPVNGMKDLLLLPIVGIIGWLAVAEYKVIRRQTGKGAGTAILIMALSYLLFAFVMIATGMLGTLILWNF